MSLQHILLAILVCACWGGNFIAAKIGMEQFPPFLFSALRFGAVGLILTPFVQRPQTPQQWKDIALLSFVLGTCHFAFAISGLHFGLDIATSVITTQLGTPFACALGAIFLNDKLGPWRTLGLMIAFIGIIVVVGTPNVSANYTGFLLVLFAALAFGIATIMMKRMQGFPIMSLVGWMGLLSAPQILLLSFLFEDQQLARILETPLLPVLCVGYSVFLSTLIGYSGWYYLLKKYDVSLVTPFSLLVPIFGISLSQLVFHNEPLSTQTLIGGFITIIGVGIIIIRRPRTAELG